MKKYIKQVIAAFMIVAALTIVTVASAETIVEDKNPGVSKSWDVRHIRGVTSSVDHSNIFYVYNLSDGFTGDCKSLTSSDTAYSVNVECIDDEHTIGKALEWRGS